MRELGKGSINPSSPDCCCIVRCGTDRETRGNTRRLGKLSVTSSISISLFRFHVEVTRSCLVLKTSRVPVPYRSLFRAERPSNTKVFKCLIERKRRPVRATGHTTWHCKFSSVVSMANHFNYLPSSSYLLRWILLTKNRRECEIPARTICCSSGSLPWWPSNVPARLLSVRYLLWTSVGPLE